MALAAACGGGPGGGSGSGLVARHGSTLAASTGDATLTVDLESGTFALTVADGRTVIAGATALAGLSDDTLFLASDARLVSWNAAPLSDELGDGVRITVTRRLDEPGVVLTSSFDTYPGDSIVAATLAIENQSSASFDLNRLSPLWVDSGERPSGVFVAADPTTARGLDDGAAFFLDFNERVLPADGPTLSNYDECFHDGVSGRTLLAGFVTVESGIPTIESRFDRGQAVTVDGQLGLTRFETRSLYVPAKPLAPGASLTSERLVIDASSPTSFDALESYAARVARANHVVKWVDRAPGNVIPNGWNSWSGGSSSGGYGHAIDENLILQNLDFMTANLAPFGQAYFQVDDGWYRAAGDWEANDRFPHGMAWLADRIRERGLIPGLWIGPFGIDVASQTYEAHPDWAAHTQSINLLGTSADQRTLDLSRSDVRDFLTATFARLHEWGYRWVKTDFTYYFFFTRDLADRQMTLLEAYRAGLRAIRSGITEDTFHLNVAAVGPSFGLVDGSRMTLDNQPVWEGAGSFLAEQGIRPTAQAVARRYFLDGRVWVNHPDLIFFRSDADPSFPPLTFAESIANVTFVGLTGGIVKVGDRALEMKPEWIDAIRRILPTQGHTSRPIDLFTRDVPEVWSLPVQTDWEHWTVVGLFHWGTNRDLTTNPYTPTATGPRTVGADLAELGLDPAKRYLAYEFWSDRFLGEINGRLEPTLDPKSAWAVALREELDRPQLLSTNRHISQGATDLTNVRWDDASLTLSGDIAAVPGTDFAPFEHVLTFHVPAGYTLAHANLGPEALDVSTDDGTPLLVRVRFHVAAPATVTWSLSFQHPS